MKFEIFTPDSPIWGVRFEIWSPIWDFDSPISDLEYDLDSEIVL